MKFKFYVLKKWGYLIGRKNRLYTKNDLLCISGDIQDPYLPL